MESETTIMASVIAALSSANAWQFWTNRQQSLEKRRREEQAEQNLYRDDLRSKVIKLEEALNALREQREQEIREMNDRIINLHEEMAGLRVKVTLLEEENDRLRSENGSS
tara:strand:- start:396 stop:725 length:330 start_codon:yes stop_codon:yes gene_type:complete